LLAAPHTSRDWDAWKSRLPWTQQASNPAPKKSIYPEPFASRLQYRDKRVLGDLFGLTNFGVNLTTIHPGGMSALRHAHTRQDEFISKSVTAMRAIRLRIPMMTSSRSSKGQASGVFCTRMAHRTNQRAGGSAVRVTPTY
jgi:hypothetical protein